MFHVLKINSGLKTSQVVNASHQRFNMPKKVVGNFGRKNATLSLKHGTKLIIGIFVHNFANISQV